MSGTGVEDVRILVTGSSGRIGSAVVRELAEHGAMVAGLDRREAGGSQASVGMVATAQADAGQAAELSRAFEGIQAVVHLAAIPSPRGSERIVFANNVLATYEVLQAAVDAGVKCAVIASSVSALGLAYAPERMSPHYVPIDEEHVLRPADPYALSKQCDEHIGAMFSHAYDMTIYAYRFPFTASMESIRARSAKNVTDPSDGERELWAYLDVRDAARAVRLGIEAALRSERGAFEVFNVIAEDALVDVPLEDLVKRFHPDTTIRKPLGARDCGYTVDKAKKLLGFEAIYRR